METPVFEEFEPASDCDCPGCRHWRRVLPHSPAGHAPAHPAAHRVLVVAAAAASALVTTQAAAAPAAAHAAPRPGGVFAGQGVDTPQGPRAALHGRTGRPVAPPTAVAPVALTRAEIIERAKAWVTAKVPYSTTAYWSDGYRQDCSGYVSMAWKLPTNEWTGSLGAFADRITKEELEPGDILLFHNASDPQRDSHVVIFGGWTDQAHTTYTAYEQTPPHTRELATPYAYWSNSDKYLPYRYKGVTARTAAGAPSAASAPGASPSSRGVLSAYPGASSFGPGASGEHITELGRMLVARGGGHFYPSGPGTRWSEADRRATRAFQLAQGWRGPDADGLPGPKTWRLLAEGRGKDIPAPAARPASHGVAGYPGRALFGPGADNPYVTRLGRQLVKKGFGEYYTTGPGPRWGEADRRGVEAFQRAQGWRGGAANGHPGPETWRRLFS
ncbi:peptidoglycan-binding protein [Streptomyces sp. AC627_RSS907]|uniref:peptidoglycan-binding protein n=1 Tax=Streptomyces sp. AC627_RSS907 TaxID=2823684 RepID=UPI001C22FAB9|nr:peptidoglycan-binding protein [Streptomyces sp. AC627_RSS907]